MILASYILTGIFNVLILPTGKSYEVPSKPMKPYWYMSPASAVLVLIKKLTLSNARAFNAGVV
jgi:hypothetical protein